MSRRKETKLIHYMQRGGNGCHAKVWKRISDDSEMPEGAIYWEQTGEHINIGRPIPGSAPEPQLNESVRQWLIKRFGSDA